MSIEEVSSTAAKCLVEIHSFLAELEELVWAIQAALHFSIRRCNTADFSLPGFERTMAMRLFALY